MKCEQGLKKRHFVRGFTLIELLVVIAVIALLMSVLLPALYKAKEQAKRVVCSSLIHQTGLALGAYAVDHNNKYPLPVVPGFWPMGGLGYNEYYYTGAGNQETWYPAGPAALFVGGYLDDAHFFFCPSTREGQYGSAFYYERHWVYYYDQILQDSTLQWGEFGGPFAGYGYWVGYKTNILANGKYDKRLKKVVAKDSTSGSNKILMTDVISTEDPISGGSYAERYNEIDEFPILANHVSHSKVVGGNILYGDSSVQWQKMEPLIENHEEHLRCVAGQVYSVYTDRNTSVSFWF